MTTQENQTVVQPVSSVSPVPAESGQKVAAVTPALSRTQITFQTLFSFEIFSRSDFIRSLDDKHLDNLRTQINSEVQSRYTDAQIIAARLERDVAFLNGLIDVKNEKLRSVEAAVSRVKVGVLAQHDKKLIEKLVLIKTTLTGKK